MLKFKKYNLQCFVSAFPWEGFPLLGEDASCEGIEAHITDHPWCILDAYWFHFCVNYLKIIAVKA